MSSANSARRRSSQRRRSQAPASRPQSAVPAEINPAEPVVYPVPQLPEPAHAPLVALNLGTTGLHPNNMRIVSIDLVLFDAQGQQLAASYLLVRPSAPAPRAPLRRPTSRIRGFAPRPHTGPAVECGPRHLHGLVPEDLLAPGVGDFAAALPVLRAFLDGRTLVVHNAARAWGFIIAETRRAAKAQRAQRSRGGRRSPRVNMPPPAPLRIVDTLATLRRQGVPLRDERVRGCLEPAGASYPGITDLNPVATRQRANRPAAEVAREITLLTFALYQARVGCGPVVAWEPSELRGDRVELQRPRARVEATSAPPEFSNPGVWAGEDAPLVQGMEFVIAPECLVDPVDLITRGVRAGLRYQEKVTRSSSLLIADVPIDAAGVALAPQGKRLHAQSKQIPIVSSAEFLRLLQRVAPGVPASAAERQAPVARGRTRQLSPRPTPRTVRLNWQK